MVTATPPALTTHAATLRQLLRSPPWSAGRRLERAEAALIPVVERLAAALRAGLSPSDALRLATRSSAADASAADAPAADAHAALRALAELARGHRLGDPLGPALRSAARTHRELDLLAAAVELSEATGCRLAEAADLAAQLTRERRRRRQRIASATSGPRASALVLVGLPALGPGVMALLGLDPVAALRASPIVPVCVVVGALLGWCGWRWSRSIIDRVTQPRARPPGGWRRGLPRRGQGQRRRLRSRRRRRLESIVGHLTPPPGQPRGRPGRRPSVTDGRASRRGAVRRRASRGRAEGEASSVDEVAATMVLVALVLGSGLGVIEALEAVRDCSTGAARMTLARVTAALRWGVDESLAWSIAPPGWASCCDSLRLASDVGASPTALLRRAADDLRADEQARIEVAAARAGVLLVLPLGLLLLPAFVLTTIVPVLAGVASQLWVSA